MTKDQKEDYSGKDRRRFPRVRATIVEYFPVGKEYLKQLTFSENISAVGVCLFSPHDLKRGTLLFLKIFVPYYSYPLQAKGRIVWRRESVFLDGREEKNYDIGIEITDIADYDRRSIAIYTHKYFQKREIEAKKQGIFF